MFGRCSVRPVWRSMLALCLCLTVSSVQAEPPSQKVRSARSKSPLQEDGFQEPRDFSPAELRRLHRGKSVKRKFFIHRGVETYPAGISYRIVDASPMDVIRALRRPAGIAEVIPYGISATVLSEEDGVSKVAIAQGKRPVVGRYTVRLEWDLGSYQARFWMDPTYHHDVDDIWGTFSAREISPGKTLVSFGFAFNIEGVGSLLEGKAQTWGLTTADRIAKHLKRRGI